MRKILFIFLVSLITTLLAFAISFESLAQNSDILAYSNDLANWNNKDNGSNLYQLEVTVVSNRPDSFGRLYTGVVGSSTKRFLGRPDSWLFSSGGTVVEGGGNVVGSFIVLGKGTNSSFIWVSRPDGGEATLKTAYLGSSTVGKPADTPIEKNMKIKNIKLVNGVLFGQGQDIDDKPSEFIISFEKITQPIIK